MASIREGDMPKKGPKPPVPHIPGAVIPGDPANLPPDLIERLKKLGMTVSQAADGTWSVTAKGYGHGSKTQLAAAQMLANKYGILKNDWFDPTRAVYHNGGIYELQSGSGLRAPGGSDSVLTDTQLANARQRAGWTLESAYQNALDRQPAWEQGSAYLQDINSFETYINSARANYLGQTEAPSGPPPVYTPYTNFQTSPSSAYAYQAPDVATFDPHQGLAAAGHYHAYNYLSALQTGDPAVVDQAIGGLEQHSRFMQTWNSLQPVQRPQLVDSFSAEQVQSR